MKPKTPDLRSTIGVGARVVFRPRLTTWWMLRRHGIVEVVDGEWLQVRLLDNDGNYTEECRRVSKKNVERVV